jgi:hypothetical protein
VATGYRGQTAKIQGGFVLFPQEAHWLDTYLRELVTFPNAKTDDQVDSTVYALAWSTLHPEPGLLRFYIDEAAKLQGHTAKQNGMRRAWVHPPATNLELITGRRVNVPVDRIVEGTEEEMRWVIQNGGKYVD